MLLAFKINIAVLRRLGPHFVAILVIMAGTSWTVQGQDLSEGLGFYQVDHPQAPPFVKNALKSVFALRVAVALDPRAMRVVDVSAGKGAAVKEQIRAIKSEPAFDDLDKLILLKEVEACERYQDPANQKQCILIQTNLHGTGFLAGGEGSILWTNAHVVEPYFKTMERLSGMSVREQIDQKARVLVFAFDWQNNLVLDPFLNAATLSIVPQATTIAAMRGTFYAEDSDYVGLKIERPIGPSLPIASTSSKSGDRVFVIGGSICTSCNPSDFATSFDPVDFLDRSPHPNSDGRGLKLSSGIIYGVNQLLDFFQVQAAMANLWNVSRMLFTSADGIEGNSGGPVFNSRGEVVAIFAGGKTRLVSGQLAHVSRAVRMPVQ